MCNALTTDSATAATYGIASTTSIASHSASSMLRRSGPMPPRPTRAPTIRPSITSSGPAERSAAPSP